MITERELKLLLKDLESDRVERSVSVNNTVKFSEAVCAFSNDFPDSRLPGYLLIGVKNNGDLAGLKVSDQLISNLGSLRSEGNILPQPALAVSVFSLTGGDVVVVEVKPSGFPPVRFKGRTYIRVGPRRAIANDSEERILIEKRITQTTSFDARPCFDASLKDLNIQVFRSEYLPKAIAPDILEQDNRPVKEQLASLRLYNLAYDCPTNAGMILLCNHVDNFLPGTYLQFLEVNGETLADEILAEKRFSGNLPSVLSNLDAFIDAVVVKKRPVPVSALREKTVFNYPYWALRELLMNALMHRDYESNMPVRFYEFSNHISIMNAGNLFGNARPENFPKVNDYRNPVIAEVMKTLGYVNRFSRGVLRVKKELEDNAGVVPFFDFSTITAFEVRVPVAPVFYSPVITPQVTPQVEKLLVALQSGDKSKSELQAFIGLSDKRNFTRLYILPAIELGFVSLTLPDKPKSRFQKYRLTSTGSEYLENKTGSSL